MAQRWAVDPRRETGVAAAYAGLVTDPTRTEINGRPATPLRPFVTSYTGFDLRGFPPGVHLGTPTHTLTAVITFGAPLELGLPAEVRGAGGHYQSIASGLLTRSISIRHSGEQCGVKVSFTPLGARLVYGVPARDLADSVVPLAEVLAGFWPELEHRLAAASTWPQRFRLLDDVLVRATATTMRSRARTLAMRPEVAEAWRRLVETHGQLRVGELAHELGWSRRHLSAQFREEFGVTPKTLARVLRFDRAVRLVAARGPRAWADVSAEAGYADQAHLVRDWRDFTGHTPASWIDGDVLVDGRQHA